MPRTEPSTAVRPGHCCFCGSPLEAKPARTLTLGVTDETIQPLACHDSCLRGVVHTSIPLAIDARDESALVTRTAWYLPAQRQPNEFELALLQQFAHEHPIILQYIGGLHVVSREFTGGGSRTRFEPESDLPGARTETLTMAADLYVPSCPGQVLALLYCSNGHPQLLESSTVDRWEGSYEGFKIGPRSGVVARGAGNGFANGSTNGSTNGKPGTNGANGAGPARS